MVQEFPTVLQLLTQLWKTGKILYILIGKYNIYTGTFFQIIYPFQVNRIFGFNEFVC